MVIRDVELSASDSSFGPLMLPIELPSLNCINFTSDCELDEPEGYFGKHWKIRGFLWHEASTTRASDGTEGLALAYKRIVLGFKEKTE
jgi:hypothetical protein